MIVMVCYCARDHCICVHFENASNPSYWRGIPIRFVNLVKSLIHLIFLSLVSMQEVIVIVWTLHFFSIQGLIGTISACLIDSFYSTVTLECHVAGIRPDPHPCLIHTWCQPVNAECQAGLPHWPSLKWHSTLYS